MGQLGHVERSAKGLEIGLRVVLGYGVPDVPKPSLGSRKNLQPQAQSVGQRQTSGSRLGFRRSGLG